MAQVSNMGKGVEMTHFCANFGKPKNPKLLKFVSFGSDVNCSCLNFQRFVFSPLRNEKKVRCSSKILASVATSEKQSIAPEIVLQPIKEISGTVKLPGSKSLSNRILLLAALSEVEEDSANKRAIIEGSSGLFPAGKESKDEIQLFLGNAGTECHTLCNIDFGCTYYFALLLSPGKGQH